LAEKIESIEKEIKKIEERLERLNRQKADSELDKKHSDGNHFAFKGCDRRPWAATPKVNRFNGSKLINLTTW
jgi:hypothetical protein